MIIQNLYEAYKLIERYETITLEEIKSKWCYSINHTVNILTGFGNSKTYTLCRAASKGCKSCLYSIYSRWSPYHTYCEDSLESVDTYSAIENAETPKELLKAFKERAKFIRKTIKLIETPNKERG